MRCRKERSTLHTGRHELHQHLALNGAARLNQEFRRLAHCEALDEQPAAAHQHAVSLSCATDTREFEQRLRVLFRYSCSSSISYGRTPMTVLYYSYNGENRARTFRHSRETKSDGCQFAKLEEEINSWQQRR